MGSHRIVGAAILSVAFCLNVVCLLTPGWLYNVEASLQEHGSLHRGLFVEVAGNITMRVQLGWTELLLITSHVGGDFFLICAIVAATYGQLNNAQGLSGKAGGLLGVTGVVLILIGLTCFTAYWESKLVKRLKASWGYSFALSWFSCCLGGVGSVTCYGLHFLVHDDL